jgi:hypothetical protein
VSDHGSVTTPPPPPGPPEPAAEGWTAGRIISAIGGSILALASVGLLWAGGGTVLADQALRDDAGYVRMGSESFSTDGFAITSGRIELQGVDAGIGVMDELIGKVRLRVTSDNPQTPVFLGIAPARAADSYLAGVQHTEVSDLGDGSSSNNITHPGTATPAPPTAAGIWTEQVHGVGTQSLIWSVDGGSWKVVAMNQDASAGLSVQAKIAATFPALTKIGILLLIFGAVLMAAAMALIVIPVRRATR